jgi:hypothetical protein
LRYWPRRGWGSSTPGCDDDGVHDLEEVLRHLPTGMRSGREHGSPPARKQVSLAHSQQIQPLPGAAEKQGDAILRVARTHLAPKNEPAPQQVDLWRAESTLFSTRACRLRAATAASTAAATLNGQPPVTTSSVEPTETWFRASPQTDSQPAEKGTSCDLPCARYDGGTLLL